MKLNVTLTDSSINRTEMITLDCNVNRPRVNSQLNVDTTSSSKYNNYSFNGIITHVEDVRQVLECDDWRCSTDTINVTVNGKFTLS